MFSQKICSTGEAEEKPSGVLVPIAFHYAKHRSGFVVERKNEKTRKIDNKFVVLVKSKRIDKFRFWEPELMQIHSQAIASSGAPNTSIIQTVILGY